MNLPSTVTTRRFVVGHSPSVGFDLARDSASATFIEQQESLPVIKDGQVLVKTVLLSNDPGMRANIQKDVNAERPCFIPPTREGQTIVAFTVSKVIESRSHRFKEGELVYATTGWTEYAIVDEAALKLISPLPNIPPSFYLDVLGISGLTAYFGLHDVLQLKKGEILVVSVAAGAVGHIVVQYAKHVIGAARVVAICGDDEKGKWLLGLGADVALNYKKMSFEEDLRSATEDFADAYFDNSGGRILDLMLKRLKPGGRISVSGALAIYNDPRSTHLTNWVDVIMNSIVFQGFVVFEYADRFDEAIEALTVAVQEGKVLAAELIVKASFEEIPSVWGRLYTGETRGKLITELVD